MKLGAELAPRVLVADASTLRARADGGTRMRRSVALTATVLSAVCIADTATGAETTDAGTTHGRSAPGYSLWRPTPFPPLPGEITLAGVDCVDSGRCMAAGSTYIGATQTRRTLLLRWNGGRWHRDRRLNRPDMSLGNVECIRARHCFVTSVDANERGNVVWKLTRGAWTRSRVGGGRVHVRDISCGRPSACLAVGDRDRGTYFEPMLARWDGTQWHMLASPRPVHGGSALLDSVTCLPSGRCWAVGTRFGQQARMDSFVVAAPPGRPSTAVPVPRSRRQETLSGVACTRSDACYAVGTLSVGRISRGLVLRLRHGAWRRSDLAGDHTLLWAVSCRDRRCYTVGTKRESVSIGHVYAARLRLGELRREPARGGEGPDGWARLTSVSCFSAQQCLTVGSATRQPPGNGLLALLRR